jgi:hypothetical protein
VVTPTPVVTATPTSTPTPIGGPSIIVNSVNCGDITATQRGVDVQITVSGVSHDSHSLTYLLETISPSGNIVADIQITIPADVPDPATTFIGTGFVSSPDTPAGTYKIIATPNGDVISTTFQAPDCSSSSSTMS